MALTIRNCARSQTQTLCPSASPAMASNAFACSTHSARTLSGRPLSAGESSATPPRSTSPALIARSRPGKPPDSKAHGTLEAIVWSIVSSYLRITRSSAFRCPHPFSTRKGGDQAPFRNGPQQQLTLPAQSTRRRSRPREY
jgi:hypothetical protein